MAVEKPVAIPALDADVGSPFLWAYAPVLGRSHGLPRAQFLEFLDALNRVVVPNPPLQALGLVGTVVGFVPMPHAQLIGMGISAGVRMATRVASTGATELFLRSANAETFAPRGLKVEIARLDAVARLAGMPILDPRGQIDRSAMILGPIEGLVDGSSLGILEESEVPAGFLGKLKAKAGERQRKKAESRVMEDREKAREYHERDYHKDLNKAREDYDKDMGELDKKEAEVRQKEAHDPRKLREELAKITEDSQKVAEKYHEETGKVEEERAGEDKEEETVRNILWILIRPLHAPSGHGPNPTLD